MATPMARQTPPDEVFAAVAPEVGEIVDVDAAHMGRYDLDHTVVSVAQSARYPARASRSARGFRSRGTACPHGVLNLCDYIQNSRFET